MATNSNAVRAGAFIVITAIISLAVVIVVSGPGRFAPKNDYVAMFPLDADIQGMRAGDDVRLGGARVGSVKEVEILDDQEPPGALTEETTWPRLLAAAAIQGMIFRVTRYVIERHGAIGFRYLTGFWPGPKRPDPED